MKTRDLELFAGPGGWDVAARLLGIHPEGLEWDKAAVATARRAGFQRMLRDVALTDPAEFLPALIKLLICSPPCQAFSAAGKGKGRAGAAYILMGVQLIAWGNDPVQVCQWVDKQLDDPRAALVLEPLRWALALRPQTIALEQVPAVLPLWEAMAVVLRNAGYSVWCGNLQAEQYDTGQTRKRAILIASLTVEVQEPEAVRQKYRKGHLPEDDHTLKPWIAMGDVIGRGLSQRPSYTVTGGGTKTGGAEPFGNGARKAMRAAELAGFWLVSNHGHRDRPRSADTGKLIVRDGDRDYYYRTPLTVPAPTVSSGIGANRIDNATSLDEKTYLSGSQSIRITQREAALLQGFPENYPWQGNQGQQFQQIGDAIPPPLAWHVLRAAFGLPVQHYPGTEHL